jgi:NADH pyrophosphatase NudC (nudix superfamily)
MIKERYSWVYYRVCIRKRGANFMEEIQEVRFCENCGRETVHMVREDPLEIEFICQDCNDHQEMFKSFF